MAGQETADDDDAVTEAAVPAWQVGFAEPVRTPRQLYCFVLARLFSFRRRCTLDEVSGSLGDLGTLIPLLAACAQIGAIRLGTGMFWMGVFNVISAFQWDIPMPVQPMKSIAAVAINDGFEPGAFAAAGIITGAIVWFLGVTQLIDAVNRLIPSSVIAGMQLGLGVKMAATGCASWHEGGWLDLDGKLTLLLCFAATALLLLRTRLPTALIIFSIGVLLTVVRMVHAGEGLKFEFLQFSFLMPAGSEWVDGFLRGTVPQLPLTCLNSVVSVCALSVELFRSPEAGGKGASRVSVASSVGLMNVAGCWFGGMPSCHGAGGLAGQYRFGARGGTSLLMLGIAKIVLSLFLGQTLDTLIIFYPKVVLGVLLVFAGVELATVGLKGIAKSADLERDLLPCLVTAAAYSGTKNMALGVVAGLLVATAQRLERWRELLWCFTAHSDPESTDYTESGEEMSGLSVKERPAAEAQSRA